ncbi:MAG: hypothetical protein AABX47_09665 [Nanoarchaeota archaeon]
MAKKMGELAFLIGVGIAILAALLPLEGYLGNVRLLLVVLGLLVGILNVTAQETSDFLIASVALLAASKAGFEVITLANLGNYLNLIVGNIAVFVAPAAVLVALKAVYALAHD